MSYRGVPASAAAAELGESPLWDGEVGLRWLDVPGRRLLTLRHDGTQTAVALPATVTAVQRGPAAQLLAVTATGFGWLHPDSGRLTAIATAVRDAGVSMNDGGIDPAGRCWAGSAVRDGSRRGVLYRLAGATVTACATGIGMSNGIDWSPAGDVLYHVDSAAGTVTAWEYDPAAGELGAGRVLCRVPEQAGLPDGLTVDVAGGVWLAIWGAGQVWRLDPATGATTAVVEVPAANTTSCAFGGPELSTLYITTASGPDRGPDAGAPGRRAVGGENPGLLYAAELPVRGRHPYRFRGVAR